MTVQPFLHISNPATGSHAWIKVSCCEDVWKNVERLELVRDLPEYEFAMAWTDQP